MLIPRKITQVPRIVTAFRVLNSRTVKICSYSVPLLKDILMALGMSGVEVMSLLDLKDAYNSLRLSLNSKKYCAITPYCKGMEVGDARFSLCGGLAKTTKSLSAFLSWFISSLLVDG